MCDQGWISYYHLCFTPVFYTLCFNFTLKKASQKFSVVGKITSRLNFSIFEIALRMLLPELLMLCHTGNGKQLIQKTTKPTLCSTPTLNSSLTWILIQMAKLFANSIQLAWQQIPAERKILVDWQKHLTREKSILM